MFLPFCPPDSARVSDLASWLSGYSWLVVHLVMKDPTSSGLSWLHLPLCNSVTPSLSSGAHPQIHSDTTGNLFLGQHYTDVFFLFVSRLLVNCQHVPRLGNMDRFME